MAALVLSAMLTIAPQLQAPEHAADPYHGCEYYRITGYDVNEYPGWTADGSTTTRAAMARGEWIAAASVNVPFGRSVDIEGVGVYRVADRGHLGARHIDVLVQSRAEAFALTSWRRVCVT